MSVLIPRLSRVQADAFIAEANAKPLAELIAELPWDAATTLGAIGQPMSEASIVELRLAVLDVARTHGFPDASKRADMNEFDRDIALLLRDRLPITPHEASQEEVWNYLTCCVLPDVAIWRFGAGADRRRFIGDLNRNTFRRLWWRAHILGGTPEEDAAFRALKEDETVAITERPSVARDTALSRAVAAAFADRLTEFGSVGRMFVMRDLMKRVLRLTPFTDFAVLDRQTVRSIVDEQLDRTLAALQGLPQPSPVHHVADPLRTADEPSTPEPLVDIPATDVGQLSEHELAEAALEIARRTGRVTNGALREIAPGLSTLAARGILTVLVARGALERRGERRGTHYVVPTDPPGSKRQVTPPRSGVLGRLLGRG